MALAELIRFRKLNDELTDKEFYGPFCKSIGRGMITSLLYYYFENNLYAARMATCLQSNIMNQRKKIPDQPSSLKCIDELPNDCISECASWLEYKDYFHLGHCNRTIYYSLHSTPKIQKIDTSQIKKCDTLLPFQNVKDLSIRVQDFNRLTHANRAMWSTDDSLERLTIQAFTDVDDNGDREDHECLFAQSLQLIYNYNVKELELCHMVSTESLLKILSRFDQIERLELHLIDISDLHLFDLSQALRNLVKVKHLDLDYVDASSHIITTLSKQLEILTFRGHLEVDTVVTFPKLTSLSCLEWGESHCAFFAETTTLQSLDICLNNIADIDSFFSLMSKQKSLRYLNIHFRPPHKFNHSFAFLNNMQLSLTKHDVPFGNMKEFIITIGNAMTTGNGYYGNDNNNSFGEQMYHVFKLLQLKSSGLKMTIYHSNMDMDDAGLFELNKLRAHCSVTMETKHHGFKIVITPISC